MLALVFPIRTVNALNECTAGPGPHSPPNFSCCQDPDGTFRGFCPENGACCPGPDGTIQACCSGTTPNCDSARGLCVGVSNPPKGGPCKQSGSIIGCETQTLGQVISVTGTRFSLNYQSNRASGRRGLSLGLGGWSLNALHTYDVSSQTLYLGNGDPVSVTTADASFLPGSSAGDIFVAARDGSEIYVFNAAGRHLRTLDALTGALRLQFTYDSTDRLTAITDGDGSATTVEYNGSGGNLSAIVAPFGQRSTLAVDGDGYLSRVTNPAGEVTQLTYTSGNSEGLPATFTDPRGNLHSYTYDPLGRLGLDQNRIRKRDDRSAH